MQPAQMIHEPKGQKIFEVYLSDPATEARKYSRNVSVVAVCETAERALELAKKEFPTAVVWQVNHRGHYSNHRVIVDTE